MSSGPFTMASGDTQQIVYSIFMAKGTDHIQSVAELKEKAGLIQAFYHEEQITGIDDSKEVLPIEYSLSQNYPNPFNPTTTIEYSIPKQTLVELKIYDILGREVTTLLNEEQKPGKYKVQFEGHKLSSGVYIYRIKAAEYISSKKMLLLK